MEPEARKLIGPPNSVAIDANVRVFQIWIIIAHVDDFRRLFLSVLHFMVRGALGIDAFLVVYSRKSGIPLGEFVDRIIVNLVAVRILRLQAHEIFRVFLVGVAAIAAIITELVLVFLGNGNIVHVVTLNAEFHDYMYGGLFFVI